MSRSVLHIIVLASCLVLGCDRTDAWDCIQKEGAHGTISYHFESPVYEVEFHDDLNLVLHNSAEQRLDIEGGENMLPEVEVRFNNNRLTIRNNNTCRFARPANNITLHLFTDTLQVIEKHSFAMMSSAEPLAYSFNFHTYVPGRVQLTLNSRAIGMEIRSLTNVVLGGSVHAIGIYVAKGYDARVLARDLEARKSTVVHDGNNTIHVNVSQELRCYIRNIGDVVIYQEPDTVMEMEHSGTGQLIRRY